MPSNLQLRGLEHHPLPPQCRILLCSEADLELLARFSWRLLLTNPRDHKRRPVLPETLTVRAQYHGWTFYPHHLVLAHASGLDLFPLLSDPPALSSALDPWRHSGNRSTPVNRLRFDVRRENLRLGLPSAEEPGPVSTSPDQPPPQATPFPTRPPSDSMDDLLKNVFGLGGPAPPSEGGS